MEIQLSFFEKVKAKKKIIFNSFWVIFDKIIRMLGGLVVGIWVSRYLGPYNFGKINYAGSIIAVCLPLVNMGMNNLVLTDMIKKRDQGEILFTSLMLKLMSGSIMFLGIFLFSLTMHDDHLTRVILIILSLQCILQSQDIFDLFNQSRTESRNTVIAKSSAYIVINIIKAVALIVGFDLVFFAWLTVSETILGTIILLFFYFRVSKQKISNWVFNKKFAVELLARSWPLIISDIFIVFYMRLDQLMLKSQVGYTEVGRYSAVVRISEMPYFLASAICISVYPSIIRLREKSEQEFLHGFQRLFNILTTISVGIAIVVTIFANDITHTLYGAKYQGIGPILAVHIWTGVFVFLGVGASNWFFVNNFQRYILIFTVIGLSCNVVLNFVLIPKYLSLGSAIATLVSQMFAAVVANSFVKKTRPIFWMQIRSFLVFITPSLKNYI